MAIKPYLLQQRLAETGRIRLGRRVTNAGGTQHPIKLTRWRFTSPSRAALENVAQAYGGQVRPWAERKGQWDLISDVNRVPVIVPPNALSQYMELWEGGGCLRRCDGATMSSGTPCLCKQERRLVCKPHTRLSVMLADVEGLGVWVLTTRGKTAGAELPSSVQVLARLGTYVSAYLQMKEVPRQVEGRTVNIIVPALEVAGITPAQLSAAVRAGQQFPRSLPQQVEGAKALPVAPDPTQPSAQRPEPDDQAPGARRDLPAHVQELARRGVDDLWQMVIASRPDLLLSQLQDAFARRHDGLHPESATSQQLAEYLIELRSEAQAEPDPA